MHTLILLAAVLSSLPLESAPTLQPGSLVRDDSIPARLTLTPVTALPASRDRESPLADGMIHEQPQERETRILLEFLAGAGLGILGGGAAGAALHVNVESRALLAIPLSTLLVGSSVGVALAGWGMNGRGRFGYALLGSVIGFVVPLVAGIGLIQVTDCKDRPLESCGLVKPIAVSLLVLPTVGAIVGYESSAPEAWLLSGEASRGGSAPPRVVPVLALVSQGLGAMVGIAGTL